ncbi:hypothetical protein B0H10DRAFT_2209621 [Mycena sp. CBHHK59/15]|nr:hypothetical protein B0H10DRAFT_2209621 [Mycena sp. CBHHK59/15]
MRARSVRSALTQTPEVADPREPQRWRVKVVLVVGWILAKKHEAGIFKTPTARPQRQKCIPGNSAASDEMNFSLLVTLSVVTAAFAATVPRGDLQATDAGKVISASQYAAGGNPTAAVINFVHPLSLRPGGV